MKKIYYSLVTKSHGFMPKALFVVFGMMLWMPHEVIAQEVNLTVQNYIGKACMTQEDVDADFDTWLNSADATVIEDCEIISIIHDYDATGAPSACGESVKVTWTATSNCETTAVKSAVFTIPAAPPVTVAGPTSIDATSCTYTDQAAVNTAFAAWIATFEVTQAVCGILSSTDLSYLDAPDICTGGKAEVIFEANDKCTSDSYSAYFEITPAPAVAVTGPSDVDANPCDYADQEELNAAFKAWIETFEVTQAGCGVTTPDLTSYTAPDLCEGGIVSVTYPVSDLCTNASITRTFMITTPTAVVLTVPEDLTYDGCYTNAEIQGFYNDWLESATATGGCDLNLTHDAPANAPDNCGGEIEVIWTVTSTSNCFPQQTGTSVFFVVNNPEPVFLNNIPEDLKIFSGFTQDEVDAQFDQWLALVNYGGGCNSVLTHNDPDVPSACGGSVEVTWTVTSDCEEIVSESRNFSVVYSPLLYDNIVSDENPYAPLIDYYDARNTAYMTNGISGSENNLAHWKDASWTRCLQNGVNIGYPNNNSHTPEPIANNKSDLYLQISADDFIFVEKISYRNNITIVICGYLEIGEFSVDEDYDDEGGAYLNNVNIVICPNGFLKAKTLELKNSVSIYNYGTMQVGLITGQGSASSQCITGTGNFQDLDGNTIIEHDPEDDYWHINDDFLTLVDSDIENPLGWTFGDNCESPIIITPLPVELLSFDHKVHPDHIQIQWITASELNNDFFTIERSTDARKWEIVGYKKGEGTTSEMRQYSLNDFNPVNGLSYYRLKQTDFDGQFEYFGPISVSYAAKHNELDFHIVKNQQQWTIYVMSEGEYNVELYSLTGQKLYSGNITGELTLPAPQHPVVIRIINGHMQHASRVVIQK